jgi:hypothetical protein
MLALILGIASAAGWIIFDLAASIVTYPIMTTTTWWIFVSSGAALVIITVLAQVLEYREFRKDSAKQSHEHNLLAGANLKILERLEQVTQTIGEPVGLSMEIAVRRIELLERQVEELQKGSSRTS